MVSQEYQTILQRKEEFKMQKRKDEQGDDDDSVEAQCGFLKKSFLISQDKVP